MRTCLHQPAYLQLPHCSRFLSQENYSTAAVAAIIKLKSATHHPHTGTRMKEAIKVHDEQLFLLFSVLELNFNFITAAWSVLYDTHTN
jgi:hypothetical protein